MDGRTRDKLSAIGKPEPRQLLVTFEDDGNIGIHSDGNLRFNELYVAGALLTRMATQYLDAAEFGPQVAETAQRLGLIREEAKGN